MPIIQSAVCISCAPLQWMMTRQACRTPRGLHEGFQGMGCYGMEETQDPPGAQAGYCWPPGQYMYTYTGSSPFQSGNPPLPVGQPSHYRPPSGTEDSRTDRLPLPQGTPPLCAALLLLQYRESIKKLFIAGARACVSKEN